MNHDTYVGGDQKIHERQNKKVDFEDYQAALNFTL